MDIDDAVADHAKWNLLLVQHIDGTGTALNVGIVRNDTLCELGKWLYGEGERLKPLRAYRKLVDKHAEFHRRAAAVVEMAASGDSAGARTVLKGAFPEIAEEMAVAFLELQVEVRGLASPEAARLPTRSDV